jgi:fission process protein 1
MSHNTNLEHTEIEEVKYINPIARSARYLAKLRAASYASDVGESTRGALSNKFVNFTYGITAAYIVSDLYVRHNDYKPNNQLNDQYHKSKYMGYWSLWHLQASLAFPSFTIHSIVGATRKLLSGRNLPHRIKVWSPAVLALATIPFIIHPLDSLADKIMEHTYCKIANFEAPKNNHVHDKKDY